MGWWLGSANWFSIDGMAVVAECRLSLDEQRSVVGAVRLVAAGAVVGEERLVLHGHVGKRRRPTGGSGSRVRAGGATRIPWLFDACGLWQSMHQPSLAGGCACMRLICAPIGWQVKQSWLGACVSSALILRGVRAVAADALPRLEWLVLVLIAEKRAHAAVAGPAELVRRAS